MSGLTLRVLSAADLEQAVPMPKAIELVRSAFAQLSRGMARVPLRSAVEVPEHGGVSLFMPAYLAESNSLTVKAVSVFPPNAERGLPTINALVLLIDPETGRPIALLEGSFVTALRTGAASGVATDLLARPDARRLAMFGAGGQAWHQVEAAMSVRPLDTVRIYTRDPRHAEALAGRVSARWPKADVAVAASPAEAVRGADVVLTATSSATPVFDGNDLAPGAHVSAVGAFTPEMRELDEAVMTRARIYIDQREGAFAEAGDILIPLRAGRLAEAAIVGEIGEVAAGLKPGRQSPDEITVFKSVGNAVQDAAVARFAVDEAARLGLGTTITL